MLLRAYSLISASKRKKTFRECRISVPVTGYLSAQLWCVRTNSSPDISDVTSLWYDVIPVAAKREFPQGKGLSSFVVIAPTDIEVSLKRLNVQELVPVP